MGPEKPELEPEFPVSEVHALKPLSYRVSSTCITYPFVFCLIQQTAQDLLFWYRRYGGELNEVFDLRDFLSEETDVKL